MKCLRETSKISHIYTSRAAGHAACWSVVSVTVRVGESVATRWQRDGVVITERREYESDSY